VHELAEAVHDSIRLLVVQLACQRLPVPPVHLYCLSLRVEHDASDRVVSRLYCYNECLALVLVSCNNLEEGAELLTLFEGGLADDEVVGVEGIRLLS